MLDTPRPPELGCGPRPGVRSRSEIEAFLRAHPAPPRNRELILAALLLWHDHLADAHAIVQDIASADGSYLHAILHRREPDYGNAKYWFRRVGDHRCYPQLAARVAVWLRSAGRADLEPLLLPAGKWDAFQFVDQCEAATHETGAELALLEEIQRIEFEVLLDFLGTL